MRRNVQKIKSCSVTALNKCLDNAIIESCSCGHMPLPGGVVRRAVLQVNFGGVFSLPFLPPLTMITGSKSRGWCADRHPR